MPVKPLNNFLTFKTKQLNQIKAQQIKKVSPHILNTLLGELTHSPTPQYALSLYNQMWHYQTTLNHYSFTLAIKACSSLHAHHKGQEIHAHIIKTGNFSCMFMQNSLIHFYMVLNDTISACRVFDSVVYPDVVSWTSIISGLSRCGFEEEAIVRFCNLNVQPNDAALVSILGACTSIRAIKYGKAIHCYSLKEPRESNIVLENAVLDFYVKCVSASSARHLFAKMTNRDVVSWTTMVGGLAERGLSEEAMLVFQEMVREGDVEPNEATLVSVLSSCSSAGVLNWGRFVHAYINNRDDLKVRGNLGNALLNMYVKCGNLVMAFRVFEMLNCKDIISWSTLISGMAMNGLGKQVLLIFSLMLVHGVQPDDIVFLGLLSACSHGGMVDYGLIFFNAMSSVYGIVPKMQHYACVVDMYGRAGQLEETEDFIRNMPFEADGVVWGALLNACRIHGNEAMFEQISQSLVSTKNLSVGTIALLSNTYASSHRWDGANRVRIGLKKMVGISCFEVDV